MIETLLHLGHGFIEVFSPINFMFLVVGLVLGLLVAILPGLTLVMGIVLALPFTYGLGIIPAIVLLTSMYVSGTYGGGVTSILFRLPGEPLAEVTAPVGGVVLFVVTSPAIKKDGLLLAIGAL